jgi:hypothetical protein
MKITALITAGAVALLSMTSLAWAEGGTPLQGTPVGIEGEPGGIAAGKGKTDARGNVTFKDLKPGRYTYRIERDDTVPAAQFLVVTASVNGTVQWRREFPIGSSVGTLTIGNAKDIVTLNLTLESKAPVGGGTSQSPKR